MTTMRHVRLQIGPRFRHYQPGEVVELPDDEAAKLVEAGLARVLPDDTPPDEIAAAGASTPDDPGEPATAAAEAGEPGSDGGETDKSPGDAPDEPGSTQASGDGATTQRTRKPRSRRPAST